MSILKLLSTCVLSQIMGDSADSLLGMLGDNVGDRSRLIIGARPVHEREGKQRDRETGEARRGGKADGHAFSSPCVPQSARDVRTGAGS